LPIAPPASDVSEDLGSCPKNALGVNSFKRDDAILDGCSFRLVDLAYARGPIKPPEDGTGPKMCSDPASGPSARSSRLLAISSPDRMGLRGGTLCQTVAYVLRHGGHPKKRVRDRLIRGGFDSNVKTS